MSNIIGAFYRALFVSTVPAPHPAAYANAHFLPGLRKFIYKGVGLPTLAQLQSLSAFKTWYGVTDPLQSALAILSGITAVLWALSEVTGNSSQVDRFWAVLPVFFSAHFAFHSYFSPTQGITKKILAPNRSHVVFTFLPDSVDERMALILFLQILWSLRLNGNTLRRDFFNFTTEDYRWPIVRRKMTWFQYKIFNLLFVAITQCVLLGSVGLFQYIIMTAHTDVHPTHMYPALNWIDWTLAGLFVATLAVEQIADEQQQSYQNWKHGELKRVKAGQTTVNKGDHPSNRSAGALNRGFCTDGLWAWSRHPNFLCEQTTFYILYLFTVRVLTPPAVGEALYDGLKMAVNRQSLQGLDKLFQKAIPHLFNYTLFVPLAMSSIFIGSTPLTEGISSGKYPLYKQYQRRVAMFFPLETLLVKLPWLTITGARSQVNKDVFGSKPAAAAAIEAKKQQ